MGIKEKNYGKAFMSFLWMVILAGAMEEGIRRGTKKGIGAINEAFTGIEQRKQRTPFVQGAAMNTVQGIPLVGSLVSSMEYGSNPIPMINTFEQALSGGSSVIGGKELNTKLRGATSVAGAVGTLAGIPGAGQISQIIRNAIPYANQAKPDTSILPKGLFPSDTLPKGILPKGILPEGIL
jgi:hypothetical protein